MEAVLTAVVVGSGKRSSSSICSSCNKCSGSSSSGSAGHICA